MAPNQMRPTQHAPFQPLKGFCLTPLPKNVPKQNHMQSNLHAQIRPLDLANLHSHFQAQQQQPQPPKPAPQRRKQLRVDTKAVSEQESKLTTDLVESPQSKNKYKSL